MSNVKNFKYPGEVTENFSRANFHIKYCCAFFRKLMIGDVLEVGGGRGDFTDKYITKKINSITLTELDESNLLFLKNKYKNNYRFTVEKNNIHNIEKKFDVIIYLHVLEHIEKDKKEIERAIKLLKKDGLLIILAPAHQKLYCNLDKQVGHYRRYEKDFFLSKNFNTLKMIKVIYLDSIGYFLYYLNKLFFKGSNPSQLKIFLWDKICTPISAIIDFVLRYKFGKCLLGIYKKVEK
jgi:SAM-dependent methyltransferase